MPATWWLDPSPAARRRAVRALRPALPRPAKGRLQGVLLEEERGGRGVVRPTLTLFLTGAECPFTCVHCDLWRHTLAGPTPPGSIAAQVEEGLARLPPGGAAGEPGAVLKLYNASNFFDRRAVPPGDLSAVAARVRRFAGVVVECHPRWVGADCFDFALRLDGRLQVALGLETVHPEAFARLDKGATLDDMARAAAALVREGIGVRAFVLLGAPFVPEGEAVEWAVASAAWAFAHGAEQVSLVPARGGDGALAALAGHGLFAPPSLAGHGLFAPPSLAAVEEALDCCLELAGGPAFAGGPASAGGIATADLWDLERLADCPECFTARRERLARINLTGRTAPRVACRRCAAGG